MPGDSYMCVLPCEAAKGDALTTEAQELYACDSGQASAACCFKDP
jgi:hypothetical protein